MSQNELNNKRDGLIYIGYSSRIIAVLFMILILTISIATLVNIAVIYKTRRAEFGAGHQMLGKALSQQMQAEKNTPANEIKPEKESSDNWLSKIAHSRINQIFKRIKSYTAVIETKFSKKIIRPQILIDSYGLLLRSCGKMFFQTSAYSVIRAKSGNLYYTDNPFLPYFESSSLKLDNSIKEFKKYLDKKNIPFLFIVVPLKDYGITLNEYGNSLCKDDQEFCELSKHNEYLTQLKDWNIPYIDCFEELNKINSDKNQWFYHTDHHWRIERVFEIMPSISNYLKENYFCELPEGNLIFNDKNFQSVSYSHCFLGSLGRKVGKSFAQPDNFTYFLPNFATDFSVHRVTPRNKEINTTGDFVNAIINNKDKMFNSPDVWTNKYEIYLNDDQKCDIINNKIKDKKCLIIKDSFGLPPSIFLTFLFREVQLFDFRYQSKDSNLYKIIESYQPDIVIVIFNRKMCDFLKFYN